MIIPYARRNIWPYITRITFEKAMTAYLRNTPLVCYLFSNDKFHHISKKINTVEELLTTPLPIWNPHLAFGGLLKWDWLYHGRHFFKTFLISRV